MEQPPYSLHGRALLDCHRGQADATLIVHQEGGRDDVPACFWLRTELDPLERRALELCRGRVLDLGAGAGVHALPLQERGLAVTAIDLSAECVAIMRDRGVRDARVADMFAFEADRFDTVISLCNGLDRVGRLAELPRFFERMRSLLAPGGTLLADSFDLRIAASPEQAATLARKQARGQYFGELELSFEYKDGRSAPFSVLQVDYETLTRVAAQVGWTCQRLEQAGAHYLVAARPL